jgi:hypothetical protein
VKNESKIEVVQSRSIVNIQMNMSGPNQTQTIEDMSHQVQEQRLHQKFLQCAKAKDDMLKSLNALGFIKKRDQLVARREKIAQRHALKKAFKEWIDFRKLTEPEFEEWHVRQGLPRLKRVEIFARAMLLKHLSFEDALKFCGYPQLSNKEKEMIRAKLPFHRKDEVKRGENILAVAQTMLGTAESESSDIDSDSDDSLPPLIPAPVYPPSHCYGLQGHWNLTRDQENTSSPTLTLNEAKQRFDEAKQRLEEAQNELNTAKGLLARIIYDEQVKLDALKHVILGEIPDTD